MSGVIRSGLLLVVEKQLTADPGSRYTAPRRAATHDSVLKVDRVLILRCSESCNLSEISCHVEINH